MNVSRHMTRECRKCNGSGKELDQRAMGAELRRMREESGLSLREVARQLDMVAGYLSDLELGKRGWSVELIGRYENILRRTK